MEEGAQEIVDAMRATVPVESGALRDSIGWTWGEVPAGSFTIADVRSGKNRGRQYATLRLKIYAGNRDAFYARFIEFGTKTGTPAQPFFHPVWKAKKAAFRKRIRGAVKLAIKREMPNG
ncbi:HK97-gp10 family putative phage morphogenesis protein [Paracoccus suum]|nr:HK97-gp10 family putative phage morphogenesis protein [Paracoccus suum]